MSSSGSCTALDAALEMVIDEGNMNCSLAHRTFDEARATATAEPPLLHRAEKRRRYYASARRRSAEARASVVGGRSSPARAHSPLARHSSDRRERIGRRVSACG